jgi:hypothetical protein
MYYIGEIIYENDKEIVKLWDDTPYHFIRKAEKKIKEIQKQYNWGQLKVIDDNIYNIIKEEL